VINKILIIVLVLAGVGLNHFQAEANASDLDKIFSSNSASTTAPETAYLNPKEPAGERIGEFSKGYQKWQVYGSLSCCDDGKGEMYALHIGYGYFFMDDFSVNVDVLGSYIRSDIDDDGTAIEAGSGLQQQSTNFAGNRRFNFRILGGGGATFRVAENARLMAGMRYLHISDAGIEGGGGGFDGLQFYAGSMFPF
jgi:hypothetical protein